MSSNFDFAIRSLGILAIQGADAIQQKSSEVGEALEAIAKTLASGKYTLTPADTSFLQKNLTLIELQTENEACLHTIRKIKAVLFPSSLQRLLRLIGKTPQELVLTLQATGHISLHMAAPRGYLSFSEELALELDYELFEALLQNMSEEYRANIQRFDLYRYPQLGPAAPALLVKSCPNLSLITLLNLPQSFFDHKVNGVDVNRGLLIELSPYFKRLWEGEMKEAQTKETSETHLQGLDTSQLMLFNRLLHKDAIEEQDINTLASMAEFFDQYGLFHLKKVVAKYELIMVLAFENQKEELKNEEAIFALIQAFEPYFARGELPGIRDSLCRIASELPLQEITSRPNQDILCFISDAYEQGYIRHIIQVIQNYPPIAEAFQADIGALHQKRWHSKSFLQYFRDVGGYDSEHATALKEMRRYETDRQKTVDVLYNTIGVVKLRLQNPDLDQVFAHIAEPGPFLAAMPHLMFYLIPPLNDESIRVRDDKYDLIISGCERLLYIALCKQIRACFMRLHPDPEVQQKAFVLFSELMASPTAPPDVRIMARIYELDMRRARGQKEGLLADLQALETGDHIQGSTRSLIQRYRGYIIGIEQNDLTTAEQTLGFYNREFFYCLLGKIPVAQVNPHIPWLLGPLLSVYQDLLAREAARK